MRPLRAYIRNYGSYYGEHRLELAGRGLVFVVGRNHDEPKMNSNGCLVGDTLIDCPRDLVKYPRGIPIRSLVGKRPWVYAWRDGQVVVSRAERVWRTKRRAQVVRVVLTKYATARGAGRGGKYIPPLELVGTADHPVLLTDLVTWRRLGDLRPGDRLCSLYRRGSGGWRTLLYWTGSGTMPMGDRIGQRTVSEQQFVCEQAHGPRPSGHEVHHRNENPFNHSVGNLEWAPAGSHKSSHTSDRNRKGLAGWKVTGRHPRGMKGKHHTAEVRARISETQKRRYRGGKVPNPNHTVVAVEDAGYRDVYDMCVPGADSFVANGVVVHNSGKSSPFDAVFWCLWGVVPKKDHVDSVVNEEAGADCDVSVELEDDDKSLIVVRRFRGLRKKVHGKASGVTLHVSGGDETVWKKDGNRTTLDDAETQRRVERVLGMDEDLARAVFYFGQRDLFHYADATHGERLSILSKVDPTLGEVDVLLEPAKVRLKKIDGEIGQKELDLSFVSGQLEPQREQLAGHEQAVAQWEAERAEHLRQAMIQLEQHRQGAEQARAIVVHEPTVRESVEVLRLSGGAAFDASLLNSEIRRQQSVVGAARESLAVLESDGRNVAARLGRLAASEMGADCSECGQYLSGEHLDLERRKAGDRRAGLRCRWAEQSTLVKALHREVRRAEESRDLQQREHEEGRQFNARKLREAEDQWRAVQEGQRYLAQVEPAIAQIQQTMEARRVAVCPLAEHQAAGVAKIAELEERLRAIEVSLVGLRDQHLYEQFWVDALGPHGLKSYVLDHRLGEMTDAANRWVRLLTGGTFWVRLEPQKLGRSTKKLSNESNVRVFHYEPDGTITERNYPSWSPGERARLSFGIDFGLSRLVATRASKKWDVLILDEVFKYVDAAGGAAVAEMLRALRTEKSSIFVVEQSDHFADQFEDVMVMEKRNRRSRIIPVEEVQVAAPAA